MDPSQNPPLPGDPARWKVLQSREVYACRPYVVVREDAVEIQPGKTIPNYFIFEYPEWVVVLATTHTGQFVLIRQYRHGIAGVHFELCAGTPDAGESLLEAAQREFLEETGYGGGHWDLWMVTSANPGTHTNKAYVFLAEGVTWQQTPQLDETEEITVHLLSREQLMEALENGAFAQAIHKAALYKYLFKKTV